MQVRHCTEGREHWEWVFPELKKEIPRLFAKAGKAKVIDNGYYYSWIVTMKLHLPATVVVWNWDQEKIDGIAIAANTLQCGGPALFSVCHLPKSGDKKVSFALPYYIDEFSSKQLTLEDARQFYRDFADYMTKPWYIL